MDAQEEVRASRVAGHWRPTTCGAVFLDQSNIMMEKS